MPGSGAHMAAPATPAGTPVAAPAQTAGARAAAVMPGSGALMAAPATPAGTPLAEPAGTPVTASEAKDTHGSMWFRTPMPWTDAPNQLTNTGLPWPCQRPDALDPPPLRMPPTR
eukprot:356247-Chlamydomonas_euryale.AAC.1